jgi:hypothetical protein
VVKTLLQPLPARQYFDKVPPCRQLFVALFSAGCGYRLTCGYENFGFQPLGKTFSSQ